MITRLIVGDDLPEGYDYVDTIDGRSIIVQKYIPSSIKIPKEITQEEAQTMTREEYEARKLVIESYYNYIVPKSNA